MEVLAKFSKEGMSTKEEKKEEVVILTRNCYRLLSWLGVWLARRMVGWMDGWKCTVCCDLTIVIHLWSAS